MAKNIPKPKASTQEHLDIEDIGEDLVILKSGWVALVMSVTSLNFDLLSEAEQDATIYAYGAFLNSLTFPLQVLVRSKKADITSYFASLAEAERTQANPDLKRQIQKYEDFIRSIVHQKTILDKKFYLIITFSPLELGLGGIGKRKISESKNKLQLLTHAKASLYPKRDHIVKQMARLGLTARQLATKDLIELFYDIYNPAPTETQRVILDTSSYTTPIVEPAVEVPSPAPSQVGTEASPYLSSLDIAQNAPQASTTGATTPQVLQPRPIATIAQEQNLRPVDERPQNAQVAPGSVGPNQQKALSGLREATAKAAEIIGPGQTTGGNKP